MANGQEILICDDQPMIHETLGVYLENEGFTYCSAYDGEQALQMFDNKKPDLVILDLMMPKKSGTEVCREIRAKSRTPIIMLTAKGEEIERIVGLELGADDYITKPFSLLVLVSKVHALMRRARQAGEEQKTEIRSGEIRVSYQDMRAYRGGEELSLSKKELQLLLYFMENAGQILSKEQILAHVWDVDGQFVDDNTVPVNVSRLKRKIGGEWIQNVRGMGYLWIQESVKE